ncbi:hypothetical protein M8818_001946 [Zalaria obscura]|uniref:Uncharacterized protein n=1 Tax=Zalaria obscura TaxID=2024903 RepID=A0ACC3SJ61_9PEZI
MAQETAGKADHLCVLIHGLWGNPSHLSYLETALREAYPADRLHILLAKSNAYNHTYDGIHLGGERIASEIESQIKTLSDSGTTIRKLSIVGYSLGGLVARYTIGLLYATGLFDTIEPVNFTTFATPHLGVRTPLVGPHSYLWNVLGARTLSTSGRQLFLIDTFRDTGKPLLAVLADSSSIFIRALQRFKHRSLYTNIINDRSAVYYTTSISKTDPFVDLSAVELNPLPGYNGVLLDPEDPVKPKQLPQLSLLERLKVGSMTTLQSIPFILLLGIAVPIGSVLFLLNSGLQTFRSAQRVKLHESGKAGIGIEQYRIPLIEEARAGIGRVYAGMAGDVGEEYLPTPSETDEDDDGDDKPQDGVGTSTADLKGGDEAVTKRHRGHQGQFPTLALTHEQFEMIENLDAVGFTKYPVHIRKVRHSHAAIVVRSRWRPGFDEGKIVVGHWVQGFEL